MTPEEEDYQRFDQTVKYSLKIRELEKRKECENRGNVNSNEPVPRHD